MLKPPAPKEEGKDKGARGKNAAAATCSLCSLTGLKPGHYKIIPDNLAGGEARIDSENRAH